MNRHSIALLALLAAAPPLAAQQPGASLQLVEVASLPLPDTAVVTGVAATASGSAVLSYGGGAELSVLRPGGAAWQVRSLRLREPVGIALLPGDSLVEAVDTAGSVVRRVRLRAGGLVVAEQRFRMPLVPANAARGADGWYVGGADTAGVYRVYRLDEAAGTTREIGALAAGEVPMTAHLTVCGADVVVTQRTPPFRGVRLAASGPARDLEAYAVVEPAAPPAQPGLWRSSPTVCLGDGYLRTLSDLRSDRRILLMYGADGRVVRTRAIEAPFAVVASVPGGSSLLAVRRVGAPELVWYDWRWSGTNP